MANKALLVGINYPGQQCELNGCVNDIILINQMITDYYGFDNIANKRMLTNNSATTSNILDNLKWLVADAKAGDVLLFDYSGHGCFSGDTRISLLNGKDLSFEELVCDYKDKQFWVYSCREDGQIVPGLAHSPRITKTDKIIKITLDNNEIIKCTSDHKFMLRDGTYEEAKNLKIGQSLMPLYRKQSVAKNNYLEDYEMCYDPKYDNWVFTHRLIALEQNLINHPFSGGIIHHKDFNRHNNSPDNLLFCELQSEHMKIHAQTPEHKEKSRQNRVHWNTVTWPNKIKNDPEFRAEFGKKSSELRKKNWEDPEYRKHVSDGLKKSWSNVDKNTDPRMVGLRKGAINSQTPECRKRKGASIRRTKHLKHINKGIPFSNYCTLCKELQIIDSNLDRGYKNHKVISIELTDEVVPVYDITVEKYHNFALTSGVFVHNSQVPCKPADLAKEPDGLSECIVPVDINWEDKMITDDDLHDIFSTVPVGVNLTVIIDACHSGDGIRELHNPLLQPAISPNKARYIEPPAHITNIAYGVDLSNKSRAITNIYDDQVGILISGCASNQTSADAWIQKSRKYHGALTWYLYQTLLEKNFNDISNKNLITNIDTRIRQDGYEQIPELNCKTELQTRNFLKPLV